LASVFIRFRAICSILFPRRLAIQSRSDQFRYLMPFVKAHLAPQ
jgi:hypothetical protein